MQTLKVASVLSCVFFGLVACVPMSDPSMGYSGQEVAQMTGLPVDVLRNDTQCTRSAAILADPTSTANERYGATTAARANACPGY
jgi:hypothetical protein